MSNSKYKIGNFIAYLLLNNEDLTNIVSDNVYPIIAPDDATGDIITYQRRDSVNKYVQQAIYSKECDIYIAVISESYNRSIQILELIDDILEGNHSVDGVAFRCVVTGSEEGFSDNKYYQVIKINIK